MTITSYLTKAYTYAPVIGLALMSCAGKESVNNIDQAIGPTYSDTSRVHRLEVYYDSVSVNTYYCIEFFNLFPDNFYEFKQVYGYYDHGDDVEYGPLYEVAYEHVAAFSGSTCMSRDVVADKLLRLLVGAEWQADSVNHLHQALINLIINNSSLFVDSYIKLSEDERRSVMSFLFSAPGGEDLILNIESSLSNWNSVIQDARMAFDSKVISDH